MHRHVAAYVGADLCAGVFATGLAYDEFANGVAAFWKRKSGSA